MYTTEFYENVKVTKPILLLSSFGGYISVLYKDKGLSSVLPVYKLSMNSMLHHIFSTLKYTWFLSYTAKEKREIIES